METEGVQIAAPLARDVIVAEGPDAASFLQGQLSQDVAGMAIDSSRWSLLLEPQGKVDAWLRVSREGDDRFVLDVDAGSTDQLVARLRRFLLRTKLTFTELPAASSFGWAVRRVGAPVDLGDWEPSDDVYFDAPYSLQGIEGRDLIAAQPFDPPPGTTVVDPTELERLRVTRGIPAMGTEIGPDVIPAELGQWLIERSVSFTKGCYTGQELVARIDSRGGNVPRHLRVVRVAGGDAVAVGSVVAVDGLGEVGRITSAVPDDDGWAALAFVKRSVDVPAMATVTCPDGPRAAEITGAMPPGPTP